MAVRLSLLLMLATSIAACATARSDAPVWERRGAGGPAPSPPALRPTPPIKAALRAANQLATLPADGVVRGPDDASYLRMRDQTTS